ncbi:MAG: hypothetical protein HPY68_11110 [Candidatus Atribacteria bacterium]|nr:hypothetical protein [Candidatus Atribacteria bacterium]
MVGVLSVYLVLRVFVFSATILTLGVLSSVIALAFFIRWIDRSFSPDYRIVEFLDDEDCHSCPLMKREGSDSVPPFARLK